MNDKEKYNREYGPWNVQPREFVTSLKITALVYDLNNENGDIEYEFELDYGNPDDRKFLGRLSFWAISNKRSVETIGLEEWKGMNKYEQNPSA